VYGDLGECCAFIKLKLATFNHFITGTGYKSGFAFEETHKTDNL
jgi:hypothetical protein